MFDMCLERLCTNSTVSCPAQLFSVHHQRSAGGPLRPACSPPAWGPQWQMARTGCTEQEAVRMERSHRMPSCRHTHTHTHTHLWSWEGWAGDTDTVRLKLPNGRQLIRSNLICVRRVSTKATCPWGFILHSSSYILHLLCKSNAGKLDVKSDINT